jgi:hypothetical protein
MTAQDSPDLVIAKRLLDHATRCGFQFQPIQGGPDGALLGTRDRAEFVDIVFIAGFSRDCYALRRRVTSLLVPGGGVVIATVAAHRIPYPWIAQTRPGGRILLPWATSYDGGALSLHVAEDGTAHGHIVAESSFMTLRSQRDRGAVRPPGGTGDGGEVRRVATVHPADLTGHAAAVAIGMRVPGCRWRYYPWTEDDPCGVFWLVDPWGSSAKLTHTTPDATDDLPVAQKGPRRLWDEVEAAYQWWIEQGSPDAGKWLFTVTRHGQLIQLT